MEEANGLLPDDKLTIFCEVLRNLSCVRLFLIVEFVHLLYLSMRIFNHLVQDSTNDRIMFSVSMLQVLWRTNFNSVRQWLDRRENSL